MERKQGLDAPAQGAEIDQSPDQELSAEEMMSASSQVSQRAERPSSPVLDNDLVREFAGPEPEGPAAGEGPATGERSVTELAKDPNVRAALEKALADGTFKYKTVKDIVKTGLETGEFNFKSEGQERAVKAIIGESIKPVPAAAEKAPEHAGPEADPQNGPENAPAPQQTAIGKALADVDSRMPNGVDSRVKEALAGSPALATVQNRPYQKGSFQETKPSLGDAVRYANQMAIKTENFEPAAIEANFKQAFETTNRTDLYKLAEDQGVRLYPTPQPKPEGAGRATRDLNVAIPADGIYARSIEAAKAKGVQLPAPADPAVGYTLGEARGLKEQNLIDLDSVSRARETPAPAAQKPMAAPEDRQAVLNALNTGYEKAGVAQKGLPVDQFKNLSFQGKNEVRTLVGKMGSEDLSSLAVTAALAKEFKEKILKQQESVGANA